MAKSVVDKYELVLATDPSSTAFVELAKAYLAQGDHEKAIAVCQQGINHHPDSIVGRVLWGKALISVGRAAEAMRQFDAATNIDRENPYAYNLIGEALLRTGLYRSAMPILRKAAALQPDDGRITQWLEQAKAALAGGPAPIIQGIEEPEAPPPPSAPKEVAGFPFGPAPEPAPRRRQVASDVFAALPQDEPTQIMVAYQLGVGAGAKAVDDRSLPPVAASELPLLEATVSREPAALAQAIVREASNEPDAELPVVVGRLPTGELPSPPDPIAPYPEGREGDGVLGGLTVDFERLSKGAVGGPRMLAGVPPPPEPRPAQPMGLLDDLSITVDNNPPSVVAADASAPDRSLSGSLLLGDIPDMSSDGWSSEPAHPELNTQAAEAIAHEYEKELKAKLDAALQKKTFLQRHGVKMALVTGLVVVLVAAGGSFWLTRQKNQGETLDSAMAKGLAGLAADTKEQYAAAIKFFEQAESMDSGNLTAKAGVAYARAMLYAEHGKGPADREAARAGLTDQVRAAFPEYALVVDFLTAPDGTQGEAEKPLLESELDKSLVHAHAGRVLLSAKRYDDALARLKRANELDSHQTLALVALGDYYLAFEDWASALEMMARAEALSRFNPERVLGHSEARLELGKELPEALSALEGLSGKASLLEQQRGRYVLLLGRALSANGRHEEAKKTLTEGLAAWGKSMGYAFEMGLGQAYRVAGHMDHAQKSFEDALKLRPKSEEAKEAIGRALLARGREKELLDRLKPEKDLGRVALVRGIAWFRLGELNRAREELARTQVGGKYPSEAAMYLALTDAADQGASDRAVELLENAAASKSRQRAVAQVALARAYLERKQPDKARAQLEEAAKDPLDYEANTLLGRLLLDAEVSVELALEPLERAVQHNAGYAEARHLLVRALLALGRTQEAVKHVEAWTATSPLLELAWRDAAQVYLEAGRISEAQAAAAKLPAASEDVEGWRIKSRVLFAVGDGAGGMAALQRANKLDSHASATFCEIGHALVRQGDAESALKAYAKALEEDAKNPCGKVGPLHAHPTARGRPPPKELLGGFITRSTISWEKAFLQATLARVLLEERDLKGAQAYAEAAVSTAPGHPAGHFALGEVSRRQRNDTKAREAFQKVVKLDASWATPHLALAELLAKQGGDALPEALKEYEVVLQIDQNDVEVNRATKAIIGLKRQLQK